MSIENNNNNNGAKKAVEGEASSDRYEYGIRLVEALKACNWSFAWTDINLFMKRCLLICLFS